MQCMRIYCSDDELGRSIVPTLEANMYKEIKDLRKEISDLKKNQSSSSQPKPTRREKLNEGSKPNSKSNSNCSKGKGKGKAAPKRKRGRNLPGTNTPAEEEIIRFKYNTANTSFAIKQDASFLISQKILDSWTTYSSMS